jgi:hypothetical protein
VRQAIDDHRRWQRDLFDDLLTRDGHPDAATTASLLVVLADGVLVAGELDNPRDLTERTREAVTRIVRARR